MDESAPVLLLVVDAVCSWQLDWLRGERQALVGERADQVFVCTNGQPAESAGRGL